MGKILFFLFAITLVLISAGYSQSSGNTVEEDQVYTSDEFESGQDLEANVLETARDYGSLDIFLSLMAEADMTDVLKNEKEITLFAVDDTAFRAFTKEELAKLKEDKNNLKLMLSRHLVIGQALQFNEIESARVVTLSKDTLVITATSEDVTINNTQVIDEEIWCDNGVIHVVKGIINPLKKED